MPKKRPEPFWRAERKCCFVQIGKKQIKLSPNEAEAWRLYHELMARPPEVEETRSIGTSQYGSEYSNPVRIIPASVRS